LKNAKKGKHVKNQKQNFKTEKNRKQNQWGKRKVKKGETWKTWTCPFAFFSFPGKK
jgi:hypothetical protein